MLLIVLVLLFSFTGRLNVSGGGSSALAGKLFVVIGAGGAGKALAYGAKAKGARVVIANRTYGESLTFLCLMSWLLLNTLLFDSVIVIRILLFTWHLKFFIAANIIHLGNHLEWVTAAFNLFFYLTFNSYVIMEKTEILRT